VSHTRTVLSLDAVVLPFPGGVQVVAGGLQVVAEAGLGGQSFRLGQPGGLKDSQECGALAALFGVVSCEFAELSGDEGPRLRHHL
jgi:hypothetical protein